jgi:hypothetical protein
LDRFECYELCVQSPRHVVGFLRRVHGGEPAVLREDFCGTAAICRRWIEEGRRAGQKWRAVGVDLDEHVIERARQECEQEKSAEAIRLIRADVLQADAPESDGCDVIFVGNFSIGYIHERSALVQYLRASRERLSRGNAGFGGGVMICDVYDGPGKYALGSTTRLHPGRGHETVRYTWEHRGADALTGMVTNAIHFQVEVEGDAVARYPDAFVYRWRLWSIPELREAMHEAGFVSTEVYQDVGLDAAPMESGMEMKESGIVCVVGRA